MKNKKTHKIKIVLGDSSGDGHGISKDFSYKSNKGSEAWKKAVESACKTIDINLEDIASEYERPYIFKSDFESLKKHGWNINYELEEQEPEGISDYAQEYQTPAYCAKLKEIRYVLDQDTYLEIYLFLIKFGDPEIEFEAFDQNDVEYIAAGGYGLFYG